MPTTLLSSPSIDRLGFLHSFLLSTPMASMESSTAPAAESDIVRLRTSDGIIFEVEPAVARQLKTIQNMMDDDDEVRLFPIFNVTGATLTKVIEYCRKHASCINPDECLYTPDDALRRFDEQFVKVDQDTLFDLIMAANYLNIKSLLDLTCRTVADMMRGKTIEEIRNIFNIRNDYTKEEEEQVRRENAWAFD